jgi:hypothetical protein
MADEISQAERRRILIEERRLKTYQGHAINSAEDERGGRYAAAGNSITVTGASPISYPQQPPGSPWRCDPVPKEEPLGFNVNDQDAVGEKFEIAASRRQVSEVPVADDVGVGGGQPALSATQQFKRRI